MPTTRVELTDTFDGWRIKTNTISNDLGEKQTLETTNKESAVDAINEVNGKVIEGKQFSIAIAIALG
jgi:hypothetical protein